MDSWEWIFCLGQTLLLATIILRPIFHPWMKRWKIRRETKILSRILLESRRNRS